MVVGNATLPAGLRVPSSGKVQRARPASPGFNAAFESVLYAWRRLPPRGLDHCRAVRLGMYWAFCCHLQAVGWVRSSRQLPAVKGKAQHGVGESNGPGTRWTLPRAQPLARLRTPPVGSQNAPSQSPPSERPIAAPWAMVCGLSKHVTYMYETKNAVHPLVLCAC